MIVQGKSKSDGTNRENVHMEIRNIKDLVKKKGRGDTNSTTALDRIGSTIYNGNGGDGRG